MKWQLLNIAATFLGVFLLWKSQRGRDKVTQLKLNSLMKQAHGAANCLMGIELRVVDEIERRESILKGAEDGKVEDSKVHPSAS